MNFVHSQLAGGINLHLCETDKFNTLTVKVFIQNNLHKDTVSALALIPMILRRGCEKYPTSLELARKMESLYGSALGADIIKIGERQIIEFYFDLVSPELIPNGEQELAEGIATLGELIMKPVTSIEGFSPDFFTQEQANLIRIVEGVINEKRSYAIRQAVTAMFPEEPFGLYKFGNKEQIEQLTNEQVYQIYQDMLAHNPVDIFVVGPGLERIADSIKQWPWERNELARLEEFTVHTTDKPQEINEKRDVAQAILVMMYNTSCAYKSDNYYELMVANGLLGAFPHSKLFVNVREKASLAYYISSSLEGSKGIITVSCGVDHGAYDQTVKIIGEQLIALQAGDFTTEELNQTKIGLTSGVRSMEDNPPAIIDRNLIGIVHDDIRTFDDVIGAINQVTREQVQAAAQNIKLDTVYFLSGKRGDNDE